MLVISIRFADTAILAIYKKAGCDPRPHKRSTLARVADRAGTRIGSDTRRRRNMGQTKPSPAPELGRELLEAQPLPLPRADARRPGQIPQDERAEGLAVQGDHRMPPRLPACDALDGCGPRAGALPRKIPWRPARRGRACPPWRWRYPLAPAPSPISCAAPAAIGALEHAHARWQRETVVSQNPFAQAPHVARIGHPFHQGQIRLLHVASRVQKPMAQLSVVGEQQKPRSVGVQPPTGKAPDGRAARRP